MLALATCKAAEGEVVNIGTGEEWSIAQTAQLLMEITKCVVPIFCEEERVRPAASEVNRLIADTAKLHRLTDWQPATSFREGLRQTIDWIGCNLARFNLDQYAR